MRLAMGCVLGGLALLTGCADVQKAVNEATNVVSRSVGKPDGGSGTNAQPRAAPQPTAPLSPGQAAPATRPASSAAPNVVKIGKEDVVLSSGEFDSKCAQMVKPFTLSTNFSDLAELVGAAAAQAAGGALSLAVTGGKVDGGQARHAMTLQLRAKIVQMNWLPMAAEVKYGEHLHDKMLADLVERDEPQGKRLYPIADRMLADILGKVQEPHDYKFKLFIRARPGENAMAVPGGFIYIDKALLDNPAKHSTAYFALSHEIAHVLQRHETRALQARIIDTYSLRGSYDSLLSTVRGQNADIGATIGLVTAGKLLFEQHFSGQELQSDACAVRVLDRVYGDDRKLREAIQSFISILPPVAPPAPLPATKDEASRQALVNLVDLVSRPVDRHPDTGKRVANLKVMVDETRNRPSEAKR